MGVGNSERAKRGGAGNKVTGLTNITCKGDDVEDARREWGGIDYYYV
jgi:hypothetical protein